MILEETGIVILQIQYQILEFPPPSLQRLYCPIGTVILTHFLTTLSIHRNVSLTYSVLEVVAACDGLHPIGSRRDGLSSPSRHSERGLKLAMRLF